MAARSRFDVALGRGRLRLRVAQRLVARTSFLKRRRSRFDSAGRIGDMQSRMHLTRQAPHTNPFFVASPDACLSSCPSAFSCRA
jgi:hypothetical protein